MGKSGAIGPGKALFHRSSPELRVRSCQPITKKETTLCNSKKQPSNLSRKFAIHFFAFMNTDSKSSKHHSAASSDALSISHPVADQASQEQRPQSDNESFCSDFSSGEEQIIHEMLDAIDREKEDTIASASATGTGTTLPLQPTGVLPDIEDYHNHAAIPITRASPEAHNSWQSANDERSHVASLGNIENIRQKKGTSHATKERSQGRELGELVSGVHWTGIFLSISFPLYPPTS